MSDTNPEPEEGEVNPATDPLPSDSTSNVGVVSDDGLSTPEFPDLKPGTKNGKKADLSRFHDVQVTVAAELGRTNIPIQDLLGLTEGSVFELNRSISSPIELVAQGIPLGNGEVVVVNDSFAIRIKEIYANPT